jgi:hypothetical protein
VPPEPVLPDPLELPDPLVLPDPLPPLAFPEPLDPAEPADPEPLVALVPDEDWLALPPPHAAMANVMAATSNPWRTNDIFIT